MCRCIQTPDNFTMHNKTTEKTTLERASRSHLVHSSAPGQGYLYLSDWCLSNVWLKAFKKCPGSLSQHCTVFANAKCFLTSNPEPPGLYLMPFPSCPNPLDMENRLTPLTTDSYSCCHLSLHDSLLQVKLTKIFSIPILCFGLAVVPPQAVTTLSSIE